MIPATTFRHQEDLEAGMAPQPVSSPRSSRVLDGKTGNVTLNSVTQRKSVTLRLPKDYTDSTYGLAVGTGMAGKNIGCGKS
jgi:hypothetical protein